MHSQYTTLKYNSKARWMGYWYQISEALSCEPDRVLVIGKGGGITEQMLSLLSNGKTKTLSLDINPDLRPDVMADVRRLPFRDNSFDVIICCQVLEHLEFSSLAGVLQEFRRVGRNKVVISVPHGRKYLKVGITVPTILDKTFILKYPFTKKRIRSKQHLWEIGRGVSRKIFVKQVAEFFKIEKEFFNELNGKQRFFVLKKEGVLGTQGIQEMLDAEGNGE